MPLTEIQMLRNNGYTADITQGLKDNGLLDKINPEILDLMTDENGKICGLPSSAYTQGLVINKQLFTDAGLVDAEGNPLYPQTMGRTCGVFTDDPRKDRRGWFRYADH